MPPRKKSSPQKDSTANLSFDAKLWLATDKLHKNMDAAVPSKVTAEIAQAHAESEFEKYRIVQDRLFESDFDQMIRTCRPRATSHEPSRQPALQRRTVPRAVSRSDAQMITERSMTLPSDWAQVPSGTFRFRDPLNKSAKAR